MTAPFPPPNATRAEIEAWEQARREERLAPVLSEVRRRILGPKCAACGVACEKGKPLLMPVCIRFSAKFKGRVFEAGERLCVKHSTRPATLEEVEVARAAAKGRP